MRLLLILVAAFVLAVPQAQACYHDSTVREQEQEFESGYDPAVTPPVEAEELVPPESIAAAPAHQGPGQEVSLAGAGGLGLGLLLLGNLVVLARRRFS